jgi:hypothetical protein
MPNYAKIKDGQVITYPYAFDELHADNPGQIFTGNIDIAELFAQSDQPSLGYELVEVYHIHDFDKPSVPPFMTCYRPDVPELLDGRWTYGWNTRMLTQEEFQSRAALASMPDAGK